MSKKKHTPTDTDDQSGTVSDATKQDTEHHEGESLFNAILWAAVIAIVVRSLLFEPFSIPSGSMFPTLKIGDYLFVKKYSYGYSKYSFPLGLIDFDGRIFEDLPDRGDIVVFRKPHQEGIDYIKRVIGLPGDEIQMKEGKLYINDQRVPEDMIGMETITENGERFTYQKYIEDLPNGPEHFIYEISDDQPLDNTQRFVIPEGYFFAMGDNRDASLDSRVIDNVGFVPVENLIGKAAFFFFSMEPIGDACDKTGTLKMLRSLGCKALKLPGHIRYGRILRPVQNMMTDD